MLEHDSSSRHNSPDRHKKKQRPKPDFYDCPIRGCDYVGEYDIAAKLQRHLSKVHGKLIPKKIPREVKRRER